MKERYIVMSKEKGNNAIQLFEDKQVRTAWDAEPIKRGATK